MKRLLCRHEWEYKIKPSKIILVQCRKCGRSEFHSKNKKYIFSKLVNRTYCWCPKCKNDLVRDSFLSEKDGIELNKVYKMDNLELLYLKERRSLRINEIKSK